VSKAKMQVIGENDGDQENPYLIRKHFQVSSKITWTVENPGEAVRPHSSSTELYALLDVFSRKTTESGSLLPTS